jgi:hypothetical protein
VTKNDHQTVCGGGLEKQGASHSATKQSFLEAFLRPDRQSEHCALGAKRQQILDETSSESETLLATPRCINILPGYQNRASIYDGV